MNVLKPGDWSRLHEACVECGTTEHRHMARGLCSRCYNLQHASEQRERRAGLSRRHYYRTAPLRQPGETLQEYRARHRQARSADL